METYSHDGTSWRKAKHLYAHDGSAWRKAKELWACDGGAWRCVYQDREFIQRDISGSPDVYSICADTTGGVLAATSSGVYRYAGGSWSAIGALSSASVVYDSSGTLYASNGSDVFVYSGGSWVTAGSPAVFGAYSLAMSAGGLIAAASGGAYRLSGGAWSSAGIPAAVSVQTVGGTCYGTGYDATLYNMDSLSTIATPSVGTLVAINIHVNSSTDIYTDGTFGLWRYDGSTYASVRSGDSRLLQSSYWGGVVYSPSFSSECKRHFSNLSNAAIGDQTLNVGWNNAGSPVSAVVSGSLFVVMMLTAPTRYRVYEFTPR